MSQAKTFGRYNLIRKVAQGGMAEIFLAKFQGIGGFEKKIIIKRILPRFSENREFINMLIHEAKTAVQLHHQNIVQIYDLGKVRDTYFISMEYIRGKDLRTVLNRLKSQGQSLPRELAVFIAREICKGLDYAHNITDPQGQPLSLVHRDISPPNVLLSLEGEVKIIDFGIAKATSQATDTQAGVFKGKFAYMAPEQASGLPVDRRADIFATGLILWEMLTTRKLLEAESDIMTLERAKKIDGYDIPFRDAEIPEQLEHIIRKALRQDRNNRYQTAGEMARDLTIYLNLNYPGFSETDLADFLRNLFNLDKRRGTSTGELISHGQGERSLTGSDFFRAFAQTGQDRTDPSFKIPHDSARTTGPVSTGSAALGAGAGAAAAAGLGAGGGSAVAAGSPGSVPRPAMRPRNAEGEFWDLRDEIEVFAKGSPEEVARQKAESGWVSQVAEDFVRADDGTLHPLVRGEDGSRETEGASSGFPGADSATAGSGPGGASGAAVYSSGTGQGTNGSTAPALQTTRTPNATATTQSGAGTEWWRVAIPILLLLIAGLAAYRWISPTRVSFLLAFQPADAEVLINDVVQTGITNPATLELEAGRRYQLKVRKTGFQELVQDIDLVSRREQAPLSVKLEPEHTPGRGVLELRGLPEGATVYVNGAPVSDDDLRALPTDQPIRLLVTREHYQDLVREIPPLGESPQAVELRMVAKPVTGQITTRPTGALVRVDGEARGPAPVTLESLEPGRSYRFDVEAPGHQPQTREASPEVGKALELVIELQPTGRNSSSTASGTGTGGSSTSRPPQDRTTRPSGTQSGTGSGTAVAATPREGTGSPDAGTSPGTPSSGSGTGTSSSTPDRPTGTQTASDTSASSANRKFERVLLNIVVNPWAEVYIDGKYVGRTPLKNVSVTAGNHRIRLVNRDLQVDYERDMLFDGSRETADVQFEIGY